MMDLFITYDSTEPNYERLGLSTKMSFIRNSNFLIEEIKHPNLSLNHVHTRLQRINSDVIFIFTAYSHGLKDRLLCQKHLPQCYSDITNTVDYKNSVFFTFSCLTGLDFADSLKANGCLAFFGYKGEIQFLNEQFFIASNVNIVNSGLKLLLTNYTFDLDSFQLAKNKILDTYDQYIFNSCDIGFQRVWARNQKLFVLK